MSAAIEEIARELVEEFEQRDGEISTFDLYARFKRELTGMKKVSRFKPLFSKPITMNRADIVPIMLENEVYLYEERDYRTHEVVLQMAISAWNARDDFSQFDILQVVYGKRYESSFADKIDDSGETILTYKNRYSSQYENRIETYKLSTEELEAMKSI